MYGRLTLDRYDSEEVVRLLTALLKMERCEDGLRGMIQSLDRGDKVRRGAFLTCPFSHSHMDDQNLRKWKRHEDRRTKDAD